MDDYYDFGYGDDFSYSGGGDSYDFDSMYPGVAYDDSPVTLDDSWWNTGGTGEFDTSRWDASEISNTATTPGEAGYGWRYFTDGTAISPDGKYYSGGSLVYDPSNQSGFWGTVSNAFGTKAANALKNKIMNPDGSVNPAAIGTALAGIKMLRGGNEVQTGGYNKPIPKLEAVREQVQYSDPNRRPGESGRQYFTDTRFVPQGDANAMAAARAASAEQAAGLQAAARLSPEPKPNPYAGKMNLSFAQPRQAPTSDAGLPQVPTQLNEQGGIKMAEGGIADAGRYLRGETDGMADEIPSSIDGEQPAALSHGEFVIPADVVSHLGNGNSDAGAQKLYEMMARIRKARTGSTEQGKEINPDEFTMGGLAAAYAGGGAVQKFNTGNLVTATAPAAPAAPTASNSGVIPYGTSASSQLSPWAGDYVTNYLAEGAALAKQPFQAYTGPLTAGASDLQQQAFAGASEMAQAGYTPGQFTGSFTSQMAQQYMNPYIQAALDPQLRELNRQSQIARLEDAGRLTKAGAYGGSRQAIMESEGRRNLLDKQSLVLGTGYKDAYDKAMQQFAKDRGDEEASRQFGANFGLKSIDQLSGLGATQRGIESEGIAADKAAFEEQRDFSYKMPQYQKDLLQGLPITTNTTTSNTTELGRLGSGLADLQKLYDNLAKLGQTPTTPTTPGV